VRTVFRGAVRELLPRYWRRSPAVPPAGGESSAVSAPHASADGRAAPSLVADVLAYDGPLSSPEAQAAGASAGFDPPVELSAEEEARLAGLTADDLAALMAKWPVQAVNSVNVVLFERHGYRAANRFGFAADSRLPAVLEDGSAAPAALCLLYVETCRRAGLPMEARAVEGGGYFFCWPAGAPLSVGGERMVVDPYGGGAFISAAEACELFGLPSEESLLSPAPPAALLAALLEDLLSTWWAAAVGCRPEPAFRIPLSAETLLSRLARPMSGFAAEAALAAAEKIAALRPGQPRPQLHHGLLLAALGRYDDAWLELAGLLEAAGRPVATGGAFSVPGAAADEGGAEARDDGRALHSDREALGAADADGGDDGGGAVSAAELDDVARLVERLRLELALAMKT